MGTSNSNASELYNTMVATLRKFQEVCYDLLLKHVEGLHLYQFQAKAESAAKMEFPLDELGIERFFCFLLDCDFLEVRSLQSAGGKDLYLFVKEDWIDVVSKKFRSQNVRDPGTVHREDTVLEETSVVLSATPKMAVPNPSILLGEELSASMAAVTLSDIDRTPGFVKEDAKTSTESTPVAVKSPSVRIRRTVVFDHDDGGRIQQVDFYRPSRSRERIMESGPSTSELETSQIQNNELPDILVCKDLRKALDVRTKCRMDAFAMFEWPAGEFSVKLLGCDLESYFFIRPVVKKIEERFGAMKAQLQNLTTWPAKKESVTSVDRSELKQGMIVIAMDHASQSFSRAIVLNIDSEEDPEHPVTYLDLDEGEIFTASFEPAFVVPSEHRKLPFQAIKVGLASHEEYLGTNLLRQNFVNVPNLGKTLKCKFVRTQRGSGVPIVELRYKDQILDFRSYI